MLISKVMPYSGIKSNLKNRTNATNSMAFQGNASLPQDFIELANKVVAKYKKLYNPVEEARSVYDRPKSNEAEKDAALKIIKKGVTLEAPVTISGKQGTCKAEIGNYKGRKELCLDIFTGQEAKRYRIELALMRDKVTEASDLKVQKLGKDEYFSDFVQMPFDKKITTIRTLLEAFVGQ